MARAWPFLFWAFGAFGAYVAHGFAPGARTTLPQHCQVLRGRLVGRRITHFAVVGTDNDETRQVVDFGLNEAQDGAQRTGPGPSSSVIIGGGPTGLTTAIMLAKRGWGNIHVYDRLPTPPDPDDAELWGDTARFYLIGLGGRGQKVLQELGVWQEVKRYCSTVVGRKDWAPGAAEDQGVERIFTDRPYLTEVLARDRLVGVLHRVVMTEFAEKVTLHHSVECTGLEWVGEDIVRVQLVQCGVAGPSVAPRGVSGPVVERQGAEEDGACEVADSSMMDTVETPFLVAADGVSRVVAESIAKEDKQNGVLPWRRMRVKRYTDDNVRIYKTVPMKLPTPSPPQEAGAIHATTYSEAETEADGDGDGDGVGETKRKWRYDVNYSARTGDGRVNYDALPASTHGDYCGVLLLREEDPLAQPDTDPVVLRRELDALLPQFSKLLSDDTVAAVAKKGPSRLPSFRYIGPRVHHRGSTVLLGDTIHTVKPYFGLGANSALEDVMALGRCLDEFGDDDTASAVQAFSKLRAKEAEVLVKISRDFDRPGKRGFVTFILPLILDGMFHGMLPQVFGPNTIAMLQREGLSFQGVLWRKRKDRALQGIVLGSVFTAAGLGAKGLFQLLPGKAPVKASALVGAALVAAGIRRVVRETMGMAPADVLSKTKKPWWDRRRRDSSSSGCGDDESSGAAAVVSGNPNLQRKGSNEDFLMQQRMTQRGCGAEGQEGAGGGESGGTGSPRPGADGER